MKLRSASAFLATLGLLATTPGCKDFYDVNVDPIHPTRAELQQLMPGTQVAMSTYLGFNIQGLGQKTSALTRQLNNPRGLQNYYLFQTDAFNTPWSGLYTDMLANNEQIITQGTIEERWDYVGVAKIQKAFVFSQLVDMFGDVPYSQALLGIDQRFPLFDKDVDIYMGNQDAGIQSLFSLIDEGIADLDKPGVKTISLGNSGDIIYRGNLENWKAMGRTLKLKLYNQIRKANVMDVSGPVRDLLTQNLISSESMDFELAYGSSKQPENRHIGYLSDYVQATPDNQIGAFLYSLMKYGDGRNIKTPVQLQPNADPRIAYYFYNQNPVSAQNPSYDYQDPNNGKFVTTRVASTSNVVGSGNADVRTLPGLYPYGGRFDNGVNNKVNESSGSGTVAQRFLTYFNRLFTEAELQLTVLNNPAAAQTAYLAGIRAAYTKVNSIASNQGAPTIAANDSTLVKLLGGTFTRRTRLPAKPLPLPGLPARDTSYSFTVNQGFYETQFAGATTPERRLELIMQQKYIASFGMGNDIYTDFRRTHYPVLPVPDASQAQPNLGLVDDNDPVTIGGGPLFPRRLYYSSTELQTNTNGPRVQVPTADPNYRIFWDR